VTGAVNAVTGAVTAVTWGRDPSLDVTGTVPAVIAVAGCHSPSRRADRPGHVQLATLGSLAHATLACATEVATALRDTRRYARPSRYPLHRCRSRRWSRASRGPEVASSFRIVPRPKRPRCRARVATVCASGQADWSESLSRTPISAGPAVAAAGPGDSANWGECHLRLVRVADKRGLATWTSRSGSQA
jgi:hypothetical protein